MLVLCWIVALVIVLITVLRTGPTGHRLDDGFSTYITFSTDSTIGLWEKEVTPPSAEGGPAVETTTMRNVRYHTRNASKLIDTGEATVRVAYDPLHLDRIRALINVNQQITFTYPTGMPDTFWAFLRMFKPDPLVPNQQPSATVTITPSNQDLSGNEVPPSLGTTTSTTTSTTTTTTA
jgi:hypothetical protein